MKRKLGTILRFIVRYRAVFTLIYEFLILFIFYLITKFKFKNNTSIVLIILMIIVPIVINILYSSIKKKNKEKYLARKNNYDSVIRNDLKTGKLVKELVNPLKEILTDLDFRHNDRQIMITGGSGSKLTIMMDEIATKLSIDSTHIIYQYIYGYRAEDMTKYDIKGLKQYPTSKLYKLILSQVEKLVGKELIYTELTKGKEYNGCTLQCDDEYLYNICLNDKKTVFKKNRKITKKIYL